MNSNSMFIFHLLSALSGKWWWWHQSTIGVSVSCEMYSWNFYFEYTWIDLVSISLPANKCLTTLAWTTTFIEHLPLNETILSIHARVWIIISSEIVCEKKLLCHKYLSLKFSLRYLCNFPFIVQFHWLINKWQENSNSERSTDGKVIWQNVLISMMRS